MFKEVNKMAEEPKPDEKEDDEEENADASQFGLGFIDNNALNIRMEDVFNPEMLDFKF